MFIIMSTEATASTSGNVVVAYSNVVKNGYIVLGFGSFLSHPQVRATQGFYINGHLKLCLTS